MRTTTARTLPTLLAGLVLLLSGSAFAQSVEGELVIAQPSPFQFVDPQRTYLSTEAATWHSLYDPLLFRLSDMSLAPGLARSWEQVSDTEWVLELEEGVTFHNGEPFNAETVKWNVERVIVPGFQDFAYLSPMTGAEVLGEYTVKISTSGLLPTFPSLMSIFLQIPSGYFEEVGQEGFNLAPIGTGPYRFVAWDPSASFEVEANADYWNEVHAPTYERVTWRVIPESGSRLAALFAGEVDIVRALPADDYERVDADPELDAVWTRSLRTPFIGIFPESPKDGASPFADIRVRRAVNHAIDVDLIIEALLGGRGFRTATLMTPDFAGYDDSVQPYAYDPELARQLLAEAGYPDGFEVAFDTWSAGPAPKPLEITQAMAADLEQVGIRATITPTDLGTALQNQQSRTLAPLFLWSWGGSQLDCRDKVWGVFHPNSAATFLTTDEITSLIDELERTADQGRRNELCGQIQQQIHDQALIIPLMAQPDTYGKRSDISWSPRPDELILPWEVEPAN